MIPLKVESPSQFLECSRYALLVTASHVLAVERIPGAAKVCRVTADLPFSGEWAKVVLT